MAKEKFPNRDKRINIRLSEDEFNSISEKSKNQNMTKAHFCRKIILNEKLIPKTDQDLVDQIRRIGININQIAKIANTQNKLNPTDLEKLDAYYLEMKSRIEFLKT